MTISFIIPVYQCKSVLSDTVYSVLHSQMPIEEILLIDDGSKDVTSELCDALTAQFSEIHCIHKENGGVSSARNLGIEYAKGDYIWFVDSDDSIYSIPANVLEEVTVPCPGMILFGMEFDYYRGKRLIKTESFQMEERRFYSSEHCGSQFSKLFNKNYLSPVWNKLFNRKLLLEKGIRFDSTLINYEDLEFSIKVMAACSSIAVLPDVYYIYKTDYDHDRTVDRIARIENVAANTDVIAKAFFDVSESCIFDRNSVVQMKRIVLQIYLDLFRIKIQTTPLRGVKKQCDYLSDSSLFACCEEVTSSLPLSAQKLLYWIHTKRTLRIWLQIRYRKARNRVGKIIKPLLKRA